MKMKKLIFLVTSILVFTLYLIYSYNEHKGRSYIYEPIYISLSGNIPENTRLELYYQTINDPTAVQSAYPLANDSIPNNTYIFKIDSSYRLSNFSIYFQSLREDEKCTITQIKASNSSLGEFYFSLATDNLRLDQLNDEAIILRKIAYDKPIGSALYFNMRASDKGIFARTNLRIPEIPSLISFLLIALLGLLMAYCLYPVITNLKLKDISLGAYLLALAVLILPTGEKICNLILAIAIVTGIATGFRKGSLRSWIMENRKLLFLTVTILLIYIIAFLFSRNDTSSGNLLAIKFGLPLTLIAVAINTNNKHEIRIQYAALLTGVIVSVFIHFGWIIMLIDTVEMKTKLISNPHHYLESSIFSRVHHSYLSLLYLVSLTIIFFKKDLIPLRKKEEIIFTLLIVASLLFAFSRAAILSLALILIFHASKSIFHLLKLEITHVARLITASTLTIALLAMIFIDFKVDSSTESYSVKGLHTRITIWENASDIIKQKPITGWGPGNYQYALKQGNSQNIVNKNTWGNLNTHNQFLETSGMFGLVIGIGLLWFLLFPTGFSRQGTKYTDYIFITAIIFITGFLFESILNRNLGILIFGICYVLLIKMRPDSD